MIAGAVLIGLFVWLVAGAIIGEVILQKPQSGVFEGFIVALWAAWPMIESGRVSRWSFLHPIPTRHNIALKHAYSKVHEYLAEKTYKFGDRWQITTADTQSRRISASLRFSEDESRGFSGSSIANVQHNTARVQRFLQCDIYFSEVTGDQTTVQFDFRRSIEGVNFAAGDDIITGLRGDIVSLLGPGTVAGDLNETKLGPPPWWLLGFTSLGVVVYFSDAWKAVFNQ